MEENNPWTPDDMLEIILNEPDDFLKVRENTDNESVLPLDGKRNCISLVTFYINKVDTSLCILKSWPCWTGKSLT